MQKFSEFAMDKVPFEGNKISINDLCGREISVHNYHIKNSKFKEGLYAEVQVMVDGEWRVFFTGSKVIRDQLERYRDKLPFVTTIKLVGKYYTFS